MKIDIFPHEYLVRFDENTGLFRGYHLLTSTIVTDDAGNTIARTISSPMSATAAEVAGFPLATIRDYVDTALLQTNEDHEKTIEEQRTVIEGLQTVIGAHEETIKVLQNR